MRETSNIAGQPAPSPPMRSIRHTERFPSPSAVPLFGGGGKNTPHTHLRHKAPPYMCVRAMLSVPPAPPDMPPPPPAKRVCVCVGGGEDPTDRRPRARITTTNAERLEPHLDHAASGQ